MNFKKPLLIGIPTKDRLVEICQLLQSISTQTYTNYDVLIVNDSQTDCLSNSTFQGHCTVLNELGHNVTIIQGECRGPHISGSKILEFSEGYTFIFRPDDDIVLSTSTFLEELVKVMDSDPNIGAVGPVYISPSKPFKDQRIDPNMSKEYILSMGRVFWVGNDLMLTGYLQNVFHNDLSPIPVEHLNSGFMYRREAAKKIGGYFLEFSKVGHREESDLSYRIFREGYKEYIVPSAIAYHYHPMSGGIRETLGDFHRREFWDSDEKLFLERMEKWLPKDKNVVDDRYVSVMILTSGKDHSKLNMILKDIIKYTNHNAEYIIANNDISEDSKLNFQEISEEFENRKDFKFFQYTKEFSVSEARNQMVNLTDNSSKYIIFIDDDARILGRYNQTTDWIDYLWNRFHEVDEKFPCGAISPIYTWFEELQCHCISVACMFTSKKVWNRVGGFDPVFGDKKRGTFAYEDTDWSYRCESAGFKLEGPAGNYFPFYHEDTTTKKKTPERAAAILRAYDILLSKYDVIIVED